MAFLECDVFFFGTASRNGGKSSSNDCSDVGNVQLDGLGAVKNVGRKVAAANMVLQAGILATPPNIDLEAGSTSAAMVVVRAKRNQQWW